MAQPPASSHPLPGGTSAARELVAAARAAGVPLPAEGPEGLAAAGGDLSTGLTAARDYARGVRDDRALVRLDMVYPAAVACLAAAGTVLIAVLLGPVIAATEDAIVGPSGRVRFDSRVVREAIGWPIVIGLGLAAAAGALFFVDRDRRHARRRRSAALVCGTREAFATAGCDRAVEDTIVAATVADVDDSGGPTMPPLAAWAADITAPDKRAAALGVAARYYRTVERQACRRTRQWPAVVGSLVAGFFVLVYGIAVFKPLSDMMLSISRPSLWSAAP